jgi:hypothetical protein
VGASLVPLLSVRSPDSFELLGLDLGAKLVLADLFLPTAATVLGLRLQHLRDFFFLDLELNPQRSNRSLFCMSEALRELHFPIANRARTVTVRLIRTIAPKVSIASEARVATAHAGNVGSPGAESRARVLESLASSGSRHACTRNS